MISIARLYNKQGGFCYYCHRPAWLFGVEKKIDARRRLGIGLYAPSRVLNDRRATREHLRRRADGGTNLQDNLVMACAGCNHSREDAPPAQHQQRMQAKYAEPNLTVIHLQECGVA